MLVDEQVYGQLNSVCLCYKLEHVNSNYGVVTCTSGRLCQWGILECLLSRGWNKIEDGISVSSLTDAYRLFKISSSLLNAIYLRKDKLRDIVLARTLEACLISMDLFYKQNEALQNSNKSEMREDAWDRILNIDLPEGEVKVQFTEYNNIHGACLSQRCKRLLHSTLECLRDITLTLLKGNILVKNLLIVKEKEDAFCSIIKEMRDIDYQTFQKSSQKGIKELQVFVDLAYISTGDDVMEIAKVTCFQSAAIGYAPLIFNLDYKCDYKVFIERCEEVWKALDSNCKLPKQLVSL
ncbi:RNF213 [Mytilus edulis]|uniref:RNF213 n=1 Tax=Mytilus edulis TaxID=6550 RepID=A0A8S3SUM1_MYTED|nr:RNF213 [Mytilus edulis]